jgi:hypothetical protein
MIINIRGGTYASEECFIAREIVKHLKSLGLEVDIRGSLREHNPIDAKTLAAMQGECFPVILESPSRFEGD